MTLTCIHVRADAPTAALIDRLRAGDPHARDALIAHTGERLRRLARRMLRGYPHVGRWEQTDDVLQGALLRLCRAVEAAPPESARHFYNLATLQIRRELLDLADRYQGPHGAGANHHTDPTGGAVAGRAAACDGPETVAEWAEFHRHVERLPAEEREVFDLVWYEGLTQEDAAAVLGVSLRTLKRRWQAARLALGRAFGGEPPG
jgi:RNA polymerase sigma-70 factor (ECF subfamily)